MPTSEQQPAPSRAAERDRDEATCGGSPRVVPGLTAVVAYAHNGVIGRDGNMPWHLPADLRRFKQLTLGHHVIMGRKTYESIGRPLPGRSSVIVSRSLPLDCPPVASAHANASASEVFVVRSLDAAIDLARSRGDTTPMVIGGGELYRLALPLLERIEATEIDLEVTGDTHFPPLDPAEWTEESRVVFDSTPSRPTADALSAAATSSGGPDPSATPRYSFVSLRRR